MTNADMITMVKADLQRVTVPEGDAYLTMLLMAAKEEIEIEGITLTDSIGDCRLVIAYTSYLYRKRMAQTESKTVDTTAMPRHLRYALNNRLFSEKIRDYRGTEECF